MSLLLWGSEVRLSTSMTEEKLFLISKNMRNTHLLDEHNILPSCEIELSLNIWRLNKILTENKAVLPRFKFFAAANYLAFWLGIQTATFP